jgi:hypothetical protein
LQPYIRFDTFRGVMKNSSSTSALTETLDYAKAMLVFAWHEYLSAPEYKKGAKLNAVSGIRHTLMDWFTNEPLGTDMGMWMYENVEKLMPENPDYHSLLDARKKLGLRN